MNSKGLTGTISYEDSAELIAESEIEQSVDLGHSMLYALKHPIYGRLVVLNSSTGWCGCIAL